MFRLILVATLLVGTYAGVPHGLRPIANSLDLPKNGRIVGGVGTTIDQVPYIVGILFYGHHACGGSIIKADTILSAAHCFTLPPSQFSIRAGSTYRTWGGQVIGVKNYVPHPNYSSHDYAYDIGIMKLASSIKLGNTAKIIPMLRQGDRVPDGSLARTSGWGTTKFGQAAFPEILQTVLVPTVSNAVCNQAYGIITPDMICAGYVGEGGKDACQNDSGGPLEFNNTLIGVVSFGNECALATHPGVYADVGYFRNWVESVMH